VNPMSTNPPRISTLRFGLGLACLVLAMGGSSVLVTKHLNLFSPPGCGDGSACDRAAASVFGTVPLLGWPTSFVGLAYFVALGAAWTAATRSAGSVPTAFHYVVRTGVGMSALFLIAMIAGSYVCLYCLAAHVGNFLFLVVAETIPRGTAEAARGPSGTRRLAGWGLAAFAAVTVLEIGGRAYSENLSRKELDASTQQIIDAPGGEPFTGRYRVGPAQAPIRIVIISDYQCPDCRKVEAELRELVTGRSDVSVSAKHFPFCTACNPHITNNQHPNACWAARAAETAGILRGDEGFWQMHYWLFDRGGGFTDAELHAVINEWGYDVAQFVRVLQSDETLNNVQKDIEQAKGLGLFTTPMIFINGVELRGWNVPKALTRAVGTLAATNLPPGTASQDRPPSASQKYIDDWRIQPELPLPADAREWTTGPPDAAVRIVAWGDYQEPYTAKADGILRALVASRDDTKYTFRHYPINQDCNPVTPSNFHPLACRAAKAAEAAGTLGGNDAYWAMHEWLMTNLETFSDETLLQAAREMGLDTQALLREMDSPVVMTEIAKESAFAQRLGLRGVPFIFINGRHLHRWNKDGVIDAVVADVVGQK